MKLKSLVAGALLTVCTLTVFAADPKKPDMDPAMMDAMMKAGMPGEAHKALDPFVGKWDTKVTMWMMPGSDPMVTTGTAENKWVMGGRYLEQRFSGSMMGAPFEGMGVSGYDNVKKQYWGTWMDSMSTGMMTSTGSVSADGKTFTYTATMADPMTGKDATSEEKITVVDANHHVMEMWGPGPDGKSYKMMEIHYTRRK